MSREDRSEFSETVRKYYATATSFIAKKFPLDDPLLKNAIVADMSYRQSAKFIELKYFIDKFPCLLQDGVLKISGLKTFPCPKRGQATSVVSALPTTVSVQIRWTLLGLF